MISVFTFKDSDDSKADQLQLPNEPSVWCGLCLGVAFEATLLSSAERQRLFVQLFECF